MSSFRIEVGMYWYGYYAMDDFGNEYNVKYSTIEMLRSE